MTSTLTRMAPEAVQTIYEWTCSAGSMFGGEISLSAEPVRRVAIAARDDTLSFIKIRRSCEATVHELISRTEAIVLFGYPEATIRAISCSRGLGSEMGLGC